MLSTELPSGRPSCSCNDSGSVVRADPSKSAGEAPACQDPRDLVQPSPKFSIRDYVFASRSNSIKKSWPFHPNSLQLCLKLGVKDPLPSFEPAELIRSPPYTLKNNGQSSGHSEANTCVVPGKTSEVGSSNVDTSDTNLQSSHPVDESPCVPSTYTSPEDGKSVIDQVGSTNGKSPCVPSKLTKVSRQSEVAGPSWQSKNLDSSCETSQKRCKFVAKSGTLTDIRRAEDIVSNSSSVSDPMASKTCPVCKVFASTSNTTLNAHIDQCLSVVSNTDLVEMAPVKPKVKAKKNTSLSVHTDHCASLDIDCYNELVEAILAKKPKVKPTKKRLMVDIYETALPYTLEDLDRRNGTNWATEFAMPTVNNEVRTENPSPKVVPLGARDDEREGDVYVDSNGIKIRILSNELGTKKVPKHKTGKSILMRKKILKSKILKNKKLNGKKYNKINHLNPQVQAYPSVGIDEDDTTEGEMQAQLPIEGTSHHVLRTTKQWVSSKGSYVSKNISRKIHDKTFDKVESGVQKSTRGSMLGFGSSQTPESPAGAFSSESPEEMATSSGANVVEQSSDSFRSMRSSKTSLQDIVLPKVPRSAAAVAKRKIREIGMREANKSDSYDVIKKNNSVKRFGARSTFSIAGPSNEPNRLTSTSKKIRKQRSQLRTGRRAFSPSVSRIVHGFGQDHVPDIRHASKKLRLANNSTFKKFEKHTEEDQDTADNDFSYGSDVPLSGHDNQYDTPQQTEGTQTDYGGEEPETDTAYASVSRNDPADSSNEISYDLLSPENNETARGILVEGYGVEVENPSSNEQLPCHANKSSSVVNNEMDKWQVDPAPVEESISCPTNNRDMGPGVHQDNSSITSNGEDSSEEHDLPLGQGSLDSAVSTTSTMSPSALKDPMTEEAEPGPSTVRTTEAQITRSLNEESQSVPVASNSEQLPNKKSMPTARDGEQLPNEKPFCCSCRGSISREPPQVHHGSEIGRLMLNFSGKQVPQLNIGLTASSSFSTYQRTSAKANSSSDPHDQPLAVTVPAESSMNLPSYTVNCMSPSSQTQLPSPSNPILRLMGKDLMVMNNEESVHPPAPNSEYMFRRNYVAPVGFVSPSYQHPNDSAFMYRAPATASHQTPLPSVQGGNFANHQVPLPSVQGGNFANHQVPLPSVQGGNFANHQIPLPSVQGDNFAGPGLQGSSMMMPPDHHPQQSSYRNLVPVMRCPTYTMKEVIVIDDSPERRSDPPATTSQAAISVPNTVVHQPFYCVPSAPMFSRQQRSAGSLPVYPNVGAMVDVGSSSQGSQAEVANPYMQNRFFVHGSSSSQGNQTEAPNPYMQNRFFVPSPPGYINQSVYYPQNMRR